MSNCCFLILFSASNVNCLCFSAFFLSNSFICLAFRLVVSNNCFDSCSFFFEYISLSLCACVSVACISALTNSASFNFCNRFCASLEDLSVISLYCFCNSFCSFSD